MANNPQVVAGSSTTQEYTVRVPKDRKKRFSMFRFSVGSDIDFTKHTNVRLERENNLREYKSANDIDMMPKFGAGSEFGREQKEEARRKKYGVMLKKYNPENQPWHMRIGSKQHCKRFKGVREGTISDNTSYFIFTQCADGAFEAFPVEHWYNFNPVIKYKYLNSEEAEEEFRKRDKTMNLFNVMMRKKIRPEETDVDLDEGEEKKSKTKGKKQKDFLLTDLDDWAVMSDEDDDKEDDEREGSDKEEKAEKSKKDAKSKPTKMIKNSKSNSDDEAIEESDEGDFDDREVDYMTDSASSLSDIEDRNKEEKYEEKGVAEEAGLRKLIDSGASSDEDDQKPEDEEETKDKRRKESDSSSSSSGSDSDVDDKRTSALLKVKDRSKKGSEKKNTNQSASSSQAAPPPPHQSDEKKAAAGQKRKAEPETSSAPKRVRTDSPVGNLCVGSSSEGISEEIIRRYLMRKPMSTKDLLQKFKSKKLNMSNEQLTTCIAQLLRKINPDRQTINKTLYLSLKKPD